MKRVGGGRGRNDGSGRQSTARSTSLNLICRGENSRARGHVETSSYNRSRSILGGDRSASRASYSHRSVVSESPPRRRVACLRPPHGHFDTARALPRRPDLALQNGRLLLHCIVSLSLAPQQRPKRPDKELLAPARARQGGLRRCRLVRANFGPKRGCAGRMRRAPAPPRQSVRLENAIRLGSGHPAIARGDRPLSARRAVGSGSCCPPRWGAAGAVVERHPESPTPRPRVRRLASASRERSGLRDPGLE